jgi:DNA-binding MarR family transcriptional regulator
MPRAQARAARSAAPRKSDYVALARFRGALRGFLRFVEAGARAEGMTSRQHQVLLHLAGQPDRTWASVGELATELGLRHHSAVELTKRCVAAGLVTRERDPDDRRRVRVHLAPRGTRALARLTLRNRRELTALRRLLESAIR